MGTSEFGMGTPFPDLPEPPSGTFEDRIKTGPYTAVYGFMVRKDTGPGRIRTEASRSVSIVDGT